MKITTILGARPQFIKASVLSNYIKKEYPDIQEDIIHTGQHFDHKMSDVFFKELNIPKPIYNLNINSLSHGAMIGRMIEEIEKKLMIMNPDLVIVYGDTNSTLSGAIASKKMNIKLVHIESGLRSFDMNMPEEINRIITDRISDYLFCSSDVSYNNLINEGISKDKIFNSGDIMLDSSLIFSKKEKNPNIKIDDDFILCTIHREKNSNVESLTNIFNALNKISNDCQIIIPLHPRMKDLIKNINISKNILIINPIDYLEMLFLLKRCKLVITDSGGLQKESYFFNKNCIVLRENSEWVELINLKYNILTGSNDKKIYSAYKTLINTKFEFNENIYGNGNSHKLIMNTLLKNENIK